MTTLASRKMFPWNIFLLPLQKCSLKYKALLSWKNLADTATHVEICLCKLPCRLKKIINSEWFKCYCYFLSSRTETYNALFCVTQIPLQLILSADLYQVFLSVLLPQNKAWAFSRQALVCSRGGLDIAVHFCSEKERTQQWARQS